MIKTRYLRASDFVMTGILCDALTIEELVRLLDKIGEQLPVSLSLSFVCQRLDFADKR